MNDEHPLDAEIQQWVDAVNRRGWNAWVVPLLDVIRPWGLVAGQVAWLLSPFWDASTLNGLAELLADRDALQRLQLRLREGASYR